MKKFFLFFSMLANFCIAAEYAAVRPSSSAIFLSVFSAQMIPWIWLISVPVNLLIISLYSRYLPKIGPRNMMHCVIGCVVAMHLICFFSLSLVPSLIFIQFILKDIYILLMFKQLWSMVHCTIPASSAKYLYGFIFGVGTLGATVGSLIPSFFAVDAGSENLFLCTLPLYLILFFSYTAAYKRSPLIESVSQEIVEPSYKEGFSLIRRSPFLLTVLLLVVFMQISVGLMDYQFNAHLELNILDKDLRTEYMGRIVGCTNAFGLILQVVGSFLLIRFLGVRGSHLFIPLVLLANGLLSLVYPTFMVVSLSYVFLKSIDFSLFGVMREMLYIPMKFDEKFRAKAVIDVFAYRSSKALVAFCILGLQFLLGKEILKITGVLSSTIFVVWAAFVAMGLYKMLPAKKFS